MCRIKGKYFHLNFDIRGKGEEIMNEKIEALQTVFEYIEKLYPAVISCADEVRIGNLAEGYEIIASISQGLDWIVNVLWLTQDIHKIDATELRNTVIEFVEALENEDTVLIADLLQYEIGEQLEKWYETLKSTLSNLGEGDA
ncbi:MAG: hypothetical protein K0S61_1609 [Anaerocolumna sp.]|jgi:hypothetical protein|nr:hypothetical protein [Anaerocolumna sp.]